MEKSWNGIVKKRQTVLNKELDDYLNKHHDKIHVIFYIMGLLLLIVILTICLFPQKKEHLFVPIENKTCEELIRNYEYCVSHTRKPVWKTEWEVTEPYRDHYLDNIIKCYGPNK